MKTIHLSDDELAMVQHAMRAYFRSFGHNEADVVEMARTVLTKLATATDDSVREPSPANG